MSCERVSERVTDYLAGSLADEEAREVEMHLAECEDCRTEIESLGLYWQRLGLLPDEEPSEGLRRRFYAALAEVERREAEQARRRRPWARLRESLDSWRRRPEGLRWLVALPSLAVGLAIGLAVSGLGGRSEVDAMRREVDSLSHLVAVSMLRQDSASERLTGVSFGRRAAARDERVVAALIDAATRDPSANVRLAAIDALHGLSGRAVVRERLAESVGSQESPLVQMAVVDLLLGQGRDGRQTVERLLAQGSLDEEVSRYLKTVDLETF